MRADAWVQLLCASQRGAGESGARAGGPAAGISPGAGSGGGGPARHRQFRSAADWPRVVPAREGDSGGLAEASPEVHGRCVGPTRLTADLFIHYSAFRPPRRRLPNVTYVTHLTDVTLLSAALPSISCPSSS